MMESNIEFKDINLDDLELNEGQIAMLNDEGVAEYLPRNPRQWTYQDIERLKKSITESPEVLEVRGLIVYLYDGKYVVIGGNMRLTALRMLGWKTAPCAVLPKGIGIRKLEEIAIKDNGSFGTWDIQALKAEWDEIPFKDWGIDVVDFPSEESPKEKAEAPVDARKEWSIVLSAEEFDFVNCTLRDIGPTPEKALLKILGYDEQQ